MSGKIPGSGAVPQDFRAKADSMRQMLSHMKTVIQREISNNPHINQNRNFSALIKSQISKPGQACHYKSIDKAELEAIWDKIDNKAQNFPNLAPREIEILSEMTLALEKNELAFQQDDIIIAGKEGQSSVYNDLVEKQAPIFKAKNLSQRQFIGRDQEGEVIAGDQRDVRGVYDIYSEDEDPARNFVGALDDDAFRPEQEGIDPSRVQRVDLSDQFIHDSATFKASYNTPATGISHEKNAKKGIVGIGSPIEYHSDGTNAQFRNSLVKAWSKAQEILRSGETQKSREARIKKKKEKELEKTLDEKHDRILHEAEDFNKRMRHWEDPSPLPGDHV